MNKNKSISGRRNRCHAKPPIIYVECDHSDKQSWDNALKMHKQLHDWWADKNGGPLLIVGAPDTVKIIFPGNQKTPRFI